LDCLPDGFCVHSKISVDKFVSHVGDFHPRQRAVLRFERVGELFGCFVDNFDASHDGVERFPVFDELLIRQILSEVFNVAYGVGCLAGNL